MNPKKSYEVSDELWARIQPLLARHVNTHRFGGGRPRADDRKCMNAIWFVLRTGCQWDTLDATGICPSSTAHGRFQEDETDAGKHPRDTTEAPTAETAGTVLG